MKRHILSATTLALFCGLALGSDTSKQGGTLLPNEMDVYATEYLNNNALLDPGESLRAYYDVTIALDGTEAAWVTDQRVAYHVAPNTTYINLRDIESIDTREEGMIGHVIDIRATSGEMMHIEVAPLNGGETFINELEYAWSNAQ